MIMKDLIIWNQADNSEINVQGFEPGEEWGFSINFHW